MSQHSVTQRLAKLSYLETDLLTGALLHSFTQQPLHNYCCKAHKANNVASTDSKPLSVSIYGTHRLTVLKQRATMTLSIHGLAPRQPHRQFGLMTHQRICLGPRVRGTQRHPGGAAICSAGPGSIIGPAKIGSQLDGHNTTGLSVQNVPFPVARGGNGGALEDATSSHN